MKLEVELSSLKQTSRSLHNAAEEMEDLKSELQRAMSGLTSKTLNHSGVQSTFHQLFRQLEQLQDELEQLSDLTSQKREEYKEADTNGQTFDIDKIKGFAVFALGMALDFIPFVGNAKGIIEAVTGRDMVTGEKLAAWERGLGVLGPLGKGVNKAAKGLKYMDEAIGLTGDAARHADGAGGAVAAAGRNTDEVVDHAGDAARSGGAAGTAGRSGDDLAETSAGTMPGKKSGEPNVDDAAGEIHATPKKTNDTVADNEAPGATRENKGLDLDDAATITAAAGIGGVVGGVASKIGKSGNKAADGVAQVAEKTGSKLDDVRDVKPANNTPKVSSDTVQKQNVSKSKSESCPLDPIHVATGHQFIHHTAMTLYGAAAWPVMIMYNSGLLQPGQLGPAWSHQYELRLEIEEQQEVVGVHWTAGRRNRFERIAEGKYHSRDVDVCLDELYTEGEEWVLQSREPRETYRFDKTGKLLSHTNKDGLSLDLYYNEDGQLYSLSDRVTGRALQLTYTEDRKVERIQDEGRFVSFEYDERGFFNRYIDPNGYVTEMTHDDAGRILTLAEDGVIQFKNEFDAATRIICQTDPAGQPAYLHYDEESRPGCIITALTNRIGNKRILVHDEDLRLIELQAEDGGVTRYTYNARGQEESVTNPLGETIRYRYDEDGHLIERIDPLGNSTHYTYTPDHRIESETDAAGNTVRYQYDEQQRINEILRPDGSKAQWTYNPAGQVETYWDYNGAEWKYRYDEQGQVSALIDPEQRETKVSLDHAGRVSVLTDTLGGTTRRIYDGNDNLTQVIDAMGRTWDTQYDAGDRPTQITLPSGAATSYRYNTSGQVEQMTDAQGHHSNYIYDKEDRLITERNALGEETHLTYDLSGRLSQVTDPLGRTTSYIYDGAGRLLSVTDGEGRIVTQLTYDEAGRPIALKDGLGNTTIRRFNTLHQLVEEVDAEGRSQRYQYDSAYRLIEVIQASEGQDLAAYRQEFDGENRQTAYTDANQNRTELVYDRSGKLIREKNASGGELKYHYDERGWLSEKVNARGQNTRYQYDASGRLMESSDEVGTVQLDYTQDGQVTSITEGEAQTQYTYNDLGYLLSSIDSYGNQLQYAYDETGRLTTLTYPDGQQVEYRYNAAGEMAEVKDWKGRLTRYRYDESGKLIETKRPNGSQEQRSYDAAGRLERITDADVHGIRLQQYTYRYSAGGQLIQEEEKQYTYDGLRRLTNGSWPGRRIQYSYDSAGNVTEVADNMVDTSLSMHYTGDNRLQRVGDFPIQMDADGNLLYVTDGESMAAYEYDARNRLIQAGKHRYRYNAQGHRIEQIVRGKRTRYVIDESQELTRVLMEIDSTGQIKARYVYGLGLIGREDADGHYHCYHSDMRGSTTLLSDESGKVTDRYTYGIYGELEKHEGTTHQPFCYNGRDGVMTDANGLYYMRARYYDPKLKRFINRDVIRGDLLDGQTFNRYAYVNGDPVSFIDPLGLFGCPNGGTVNKYTYNMVENPGPLAEINPGAASTFRSGMYNVTKLESDTILYRSGKAGGGKNALGQYFTRESGTKIEGRIDSAVKAQWIDPKTGVLTGSSPLDTVYEIKIPKGTTIYEGPAGYQGSIYLGGGNQIFVPEPWKINGVEVISSSPIR